MAVESCGDIYALPEECIANALSLTSPKDVCRLSAVASTFRSASQSDTVWERFLPSDYREILAGADAGADSLPEKFNSKKDLYLHLCNHPVLIDGGRKSLCLDKLSGKKCFMLCPRDLVIVWGDTPEYWKWISLPESRFSEVAELVNVCWLEVRGKIDVSMLSSGTNYAAYLVFSITGLNGFDRVGEAFVVVNGEETAKRSICLDPDGAKRQSYQIVPRNVGVFYHRLRMRRWMQQEAHNAGWDENTVFPSVRDDGWMEVELGEYFVQGGDIGDLEVALMEVKGGNWKSGIVVGGIEFRPKRV